MIQAITWGVVLTSGAGMSRLGSDQQRDLGGVAAGEPLQLIVAEPAGVDDHPSLGTAEGDPRDRAFPGHPHRQGPDLVQGHLGVEADPPLGGAPVHVVLDPVAAEDLD